MFEFDDPFPDRTGAEWQGSWTFFEDRFIHFYLF